MTLKLKKITTFNRTVEVKLADGSEGSFKAEFKYLSRAQLDELLGEGMPDAEFVDRVLVGVVGILDSDNQPASLETAKEAIKADIALTTATVRTFLDALGGAPAKNSPTSRGR